MIEEQQHLPSHADLSPAAQALSELTSPSLGALFRRPQRIGKPSGWWEHVPFAAWVVQACEPRILVELGTHHGVSYAAFCEAVLNTGLPTRCFAIDHWRGDSQAGLYEDAVHQDLHAFNQLHYAAFSELIRADFDAAADRFEDGSIDLLHIDGFHSYEAVRHDYETWAPKLSARAVVLFHDTNVRRDDFGVHRLFAELAATAPHFEFLHGYGLGVIAHGSRVPTPLRQLCACAQDHNTFAIRERFSRLGALWSSLSREQEAGRAFAEQVAALESRHLDALNERNAAMSEQANALMLAQRARDVERGRVELMRLRLEEAVERPTQVADDAASEQLAQAARQIASMSNDLAGLELKARQQAQAHSELLDRLRQSQSHQTSAAQWLEAATREREALLTHQGQMQAHAQHYAGQVGRLVQYLMRRHNEVAKPKASQSRQDIANVLRQPARWLRRHAPQRVPAPLRFLVPALKWGLAQLSPVPRVVRHSMLFDADWYVARYADVGASAIDPAFHYAIAGGAQGRDPGPWFSTQGYLQANPDVARERVNALYHYETRGCSEGRPLVWSSSEPTQPPIDTSRQIFREQGMQALNALLLDAQARIAIPSSTAPLVSIVMVLHNQVELTLRCLESLAHPTDVPFELIIVDNASTDRTSELLARVDGAKVLRQASNLHFLHGANAGARAARGRHLLFLNNDTQVAPGSLEAASAVLEEHADAGAVGGRIVLLNGRLQEAGAIIWRDGTCAGYGRNEDPEHPAYGFRREVDYCSGAFLMVRREAFESLAGFDSAFAPAYYEDTDLCMRLRSAGWRVIFEPGVRITHFENGSAPTADSAAVLMRTNHAIFVQRHAHTLQDSHRPPSEGTLRARSRPPRGARVLFLDDQLPLPSQGAGNPRARRIVEELQAAGTFVTHYPMVGPQADLDAAVRVLPAELEAIADMRRPPLAQLLRERIGYYDMVLVSRPHNMRRFLECCERDVPQFLASTRLVYDAEAIFALRESMRREVLSLSPDKRSPESLLAEELSLLGQASVALAVSEAEAAHLRKGGCADVRVLGHALTAQPTPSAFDTREGLLFVGRLYEDDSPNVDSLRWFVQEVMPRLDRLMGDYWTLHVVGGHSPALAAQLACARVRFHGRVDDITHFYDRARVFVAPTRFAAGIPHKVHEAAARGLPSVVTPLLRAQLGWAEGEALLSADTAENFAQACARLHGEPSLWERVRERGLAQVTLDCSAATFRSTVQGLLAAGPVAPDAKTAATDNRDITARTWSTPPDTRRREQGMSWMEHPAIVPRLNRLATGRADVHCLEHLLAILRAERRPLPLARVASLGCGFGGLEHHLAALGFAHRIDGYDIADGALAQARQHAAEAGLRQVHYHVADLEREPLPEGAFDIIFACHSVHHIEGLDGLFANVRQALRPGGILHMQEYIGPNRFQWTDAQLEGINEFQRTLPRRLRMLPGGIERGPVTRPSVAEVIAVDPSEAVCSAQIVASLSRHLTVRENRSLGGALLHVGLSGIAQNFDPANDEDVAHLQRFIDMEDAWMAQGRIGTDFAVLIAQRD